MPTFEQHIGKAHHNEEFVARIKSDPNFLDWAVTGYFYAAVHYIESYFAKFLGRHSTDHGERLTTVNRDSILKEIYPAFRSLQDDSEEARYGVFEFTEGDVDNQVKGRLEKIKSRLKSKLSDYKEI